MAEPQSPILPRLQSYERQTRLMDEDLMNVDSTYQGGSRATYEARIDKELKVYQSRIKEQTQILSRLQRSESNKLGYVLSEMPAPGLADELQQLKTYTSAYRALVDSEQTLPPPDSPLPALLALRESHQVMNGTKSSMSALKVECLQTEEELELVQSDLRDANTILKSLEKRIDTLRAEKEQKYQMSPSEQANNIIEGLGQQAATYKMETDDLVSSLNDFIDNQLAIMLLVEEQGGPVVNGSWDSLTGDSETDSRQQRIDVLWSQKRSKEKESDKEEIENEVRNLIEELLNASAAADGRGTGSYVYLTRDSAAARFLVRARVAQFHPRDARRLRLYDFGRDYDD